MEPDEKCIYEDCNNASLEPEGKKAEYPSGILTEYLCCPRCGQAYTLIAGKLSTVHIHS